MKKTALSLVCILSLIFAFCGCECEEEKKAPPAPQAEKQVKKLPPEKAEPEEKEAPVIDLPEEPGDAFIGWSESMRHFAFRAERSLKGGEMEYNLYLVQTAVSQQTDGGTGALSLRYVKKGEEPEKKAVTPEKDGDGEKAGQVSEKASAPVLIEEKDSVRLFNERAQKILSRYNFSRKPELGELLFDKGSFLGLFGKKPLPENADYAVKLPGKRKASLLMDVETRRIDRSKRPVTPLKRESAVVIKLLVEGGADKAPVELVLLEGTTFKAGISGYWLRSAHLSPNGRNIVVILESYTDEAAHPRGRGRVALTGVGARIFSPGKKGALIKPMKFRAFPRKQIDRGEAGETKKNLENIGKKMKKGN